MILFVTVVMITGCGSGSLPTPVDGTIVYLERCTSFWKVRGMRPRIKISCTSATVLYAERELIIHGAKQFGSHGGMEWIGNVSIEGSSLIFELPTDSDYRIFVGNQKHTLPKIAQTE